MNEILKILFHRHRWNYVKFTPSNENYNGQGRWCECGDREVLWHYPGSPSLGDSSGWRWTKDYHGLIKEIKE